MTAEIVKAAPTAASLPDLVRYAEHLAHADLLPKQFVGRPANVLYAIEYGRTLGITPVAALTGIHVIEGKPSASSGLIGALVRQAGHKLRVSSDGATRATAQIVRADDPDFTYEATWTLQRAEIAGLCQIKDGKPWARDRNGKPTAWEKYPAAMLKARAITEVARDACEDVLFGLHYTPEELGAYVDQDGNPVDAPVQQLRAVQLGQPEPGTAPAPGPAAEQRLAEDAAHSTDPDAIREMYKQAVRAGQVTTQVMTPLGTMLLGEYLVTRGKQLTASAHAPSTPAAAEDDIPEAEVVADGEDAERTTAIAELQAAAQAAGLTPADLTEGFYAANGMAIDDAGLGPIREMTTMLRSAA
jgi:hypothetical protein